MERTVRDIIIYPIKGMQGISVSSAKCEKRGLEHDRRFMLVDQDGLFLSQRNTPNLTQFKINPNKDNYQISYGEHSIVLDRVPNTSGSIQVKVWSHTFSASLVSNGHDDFFTECLGRPCHLVYMDDSVIRVKTMVKKPYKSQLSFADGYPYLILGIASVNHLNSKLDHPIDASRFRANIMVDTVEPHEEDDWGSIQIGDVNFSVIKPCARCQVINIDQQTGKNYKEPIATLNKYRKEGNKILFGANAALLAQHGVINIGDKIQ